jgi:hypothetical protein
MFKLGDFVRCDGKVGLIAFIHTEDKLISVNFLGYEKCRFENEIILITREEFFLTLKAESAIIKE